MTAVGATAIEDKLQEGVPATLQHLLEANIKVWMLPAPGLPRYLPAPPPPSIISVQHPSCC